MVAVAVEVPDITPVAPLEVEVYVVRAVTVAMLSCARVGMLAELATLQAELTTGQAGGLFVGVYADQDVLTGVADR